MALIFDVIVVLTASTLIAAQNVLSSLPQTTISPYVNTEVDVIDADNNDSVVSNGTISITTSPDSSSSDSPTSPSSMTTQLQTTVNTLTTIPVTSTTTSAPTTTVYSTTDSTTFTTRVSVTTSRSPLTPSTEAPTTEALTSEPSSEPSTEHFETTTTEQPPPTTSVPPKEPNTWLSVFLSVFILLAVILLIGVAVWFIRRRRQLERLRHQLMPMYNFDPTDDVDDWENQLLEEERSLRPEADKVQMYSGNSTFDPSKSTPTNITPKD